MAVPKIEGSQRDFSAGELDVSMKRADESPVMKTGARQMSNWRILNSKAVTNRPGRSALFFETGRVEEVTMSPGNNFFLVFGNGYLRVYNASGTKVFESFVKGDAVTPIPWGPSTFGGITFAILQFSVYIAYSNPPGNIPQILSWDGVSQTSTWTLSSYIEFVTQGGQKRTPFYRISPPNVTIVPSGQTGNITLVYSANIVTSSLIGTRLSWCGRQITITGVISPNQATALVDEQLYGSEALPFGSSPVGIFNIGDEVIGSVSGAKGIVGSVTAGGSPQITVQIIPPGLSFVASDVVVGPGGGLAMSGGASAGAPGPSPIWNDEVMNSVRGYPQSVFVDQGRLGFTNFPSVPSGIVWSTIGVPTDIWDDPAVATPSTSNAIFEIAPGKSQVLYVIPGMESSEFVFCDNAIYYIPITVQNPLVPGSVEFIEIAAYGGMPNVQPRRAEQTIVYMKAGGIQVGVIQAPGAYYRPYVIDDISQFHSHLFIGQTPVAIAIPAASTQFEELYIYISFASGTLAVGKYAMRSGLVEPGSDGKPNVGWVPWNGAGTVQWTSALGSSVYFVTTYGSTSIVEILDNTQYLDGAVSVNNLPTPLQPPGGLGPLWWQAGGSVTLLDQGTRMMGTYQVDANGNIIPQSNAGENLASSQLMAGQPWTGILEPFAPIAQPGGQSIKQRLRKRRSSWLAAYVSSSTGFLWARLFGGPLYPGGPALGAQMNTRRVETWNQGDDPTQPPPLREEVESWRPIGKDYDIRRAIIKDTPGPLIVHEIAMEVTA